MSKVALRLPCVAALILCATGRDAAAQTKTQKKAASPPCADSVTTKSGVYTSQQALRGRDVYAGMCRNCHTPESHTGAVFNAKWKGRSLAELYTYIRDQMPKNEPGSLSEQENADVLAYLLRLNQMPAGQNELSTDATALKRIRIEGLKP
jgi:mono/diheme cytochrome c family protein